MVFSIGPRILPHFAGVQAIFSKRLMLFSLLLLQTGCLLRVSSEPLAYEGILPFAWKVLPISGVLELSAVLIFATNLSLTFLLGHSVFATDGPRARCCGVMPSRNLQPESTFCCTRCVILNPNRVSSLYRAYSTGKSIRIVSRYS